MDSDLMDNSQRCFERLQAGDADGLRQILEEDPGCVEARDANGVSLLMQSLYRGRRDLAEMIADRKKPLDIFEAASLGRPAPPKALESKRMSLLMQSLYRGRRDLAEMIADRKKPLDIFEAASLGRLAPLKAL